MQKFVSYIRHRIKRLFQRISINSQRRMMIENDKNRPKSPYSDEAFRLCKHFITRQDSSLSMSPDGTKYISNVSENIDIIMKNNLIEIILNKTYPYDVILGNVDYHRIVRIFDNNHETRLKKREEEITSGVKRSLKNVLESIELKQK